MEYLLNCNSPYAVYTLIELLTDEETRKLYGLPAPSMEEEIELFHKMVVSSNTTISNLSKFLKGVRNKYKYHEYRIGKLDAKAAKSIDAFASRFEYMQKNHWEKAPKKISQNNVSDRYYSTQYKTNSNTRIYDSYEYGLSDW